MTKVANGGSPQAVDDSTSDLNVRARRKVADPKLPAIVTATSRATNLGSAASAPLIQRISDSIRPTQNGQAAYEPLQIQASLSRLSKELERFDLDNEGLLRTANQLLAEELLRVEILRYRLQGTIRG